MPGQNLAPRLRRLPRELVAGLDIPVAASFRSRLLGLALLDSREAGAGLLLPRCSSVHTFGMRFRLNLFFLDPRNAVIEIRREVPPRRFAANRNATAVLEIPSDRDAQAVKLCGPVADLVGENHEGADASL